MSDIGWVHVFRPLNGNVIARGKRAFVELNSHLRWRRHHRALLVRLLRTRRYARGMQRVTGTVVLWSDEEGWGALRTESAPSDVFAHFSNLIREGYLDLRVGQRVQFLLEPFPTGQDGYFYRADEVGIIE